jgi:large subunit ribosomal protein L22
MAKKQARAESKFVRISPQKMRSVADGVRKMSPQEALDALQFMNKKGAKPLRKTIKSAIANAAHNFDMDKDNLTFKEINIGEGTTYKRWRPVARGRAHQILKRTSHIKVILEENNGTES